MGSFVAPSQSPYHIFRVYSRSATRQRFVFISCVLLAVLRPVGDTTKNRGRPKGGPKILVYI